MRSQTDTRDGRHRMNLLVRKLQASVTRRTTRKLELIPEWSVSRNAYMMSEAFQVRSALASLVAGRVIPTARSNFGSNANLV